MSINAVFAKLSTDGAVTALVGNCIEPCVAKQTDTYPLIAMEEESIEHGGTHSGSDGTATSVIKLDCEGTTYTSAAAVAAAVRASLNFQKGVWGGITVQGSFIDDESDDYEYQNNEKVYYGISVRVTVIYNL